MNFLQGTDTVYVSEVSHETSY